MIKLKAIKLHWINDSPDDPKDLCAHGCVEFSIGELDVVRPEDGDWCVSAAALYLLRTLSQSHTPVSPVGEHIFPCCGHSMYWDKDQEDCIIFGCPNGINFELIHKDGNVEIKISEEQVAHISFEAWRDSVCIFSDQISDFYRASAPKEPYDEDAKKGFDAFQREWTRRRKQAETLV